MLKNGDIVSDGKRILKLGHFIGDFVGSEYICHFEVFLANGKEDEYTYISENGFVYELDDGVGRSAKFTINEELPRFWPAKRPEKEKFEELGREFERLEEELKLISEN
jgi:hypothetical protein